MKFLGQNLFPVIACLLVIYMAWDGNRDRARIFEQREAQMKLLLQAADDDKKLAEEQRRAMDDMRQRTEAIVDALEDPDRVCLGPGDTDRLRQLWP